MRVLGWFTSTVTLVVLCLGIVPALAQDTPTSNALQTFPITVSLVGQSTEASVPTPTLREMGPCTCNLNAGLCDASCGCDPDCTAADIALFASFLPDGPVTQNLTSCVDPDLVRVNKRGDLTANLLGNLMCVTKENYPTKGTFLTTPTAFTATQLNDVRGMYDGATFPSALAASTATSSSTSTSSSTAYSTGASIPRALKTDDGAGGFTLSYTSPAYLSVPSTDMQGACSDASPARFLADSASASCLRSSRDVVPAVACAAGGSFAPSTVLTSMAVGATPGATLADTTGWVSVLIADVYTADAATGTFTHTYDIATAVAAGQQLEEVTPYAFAAPVWDAATCTCTGALLSASYSVAYSSAGAITRVNATAVVGTVTAVLPCAAGPVSFRQSWGAVFPAAGTFQATAAVAHLDSGLVTAFTRSGNPGYLQGAPVLAGSLVDVTDPTAADPTAVVGTAIARSVGGLSALVFDAAGECHPTSDPISMLRFTRAAAVGASSAYDCAVPLTRAQLETLCTDAAGLQQYLLPTQTHVGVWGNASAENLFDWLAITTESFPTTTGTWIDETSTCANLVTTLNIEIITADYGSKYNPQRAVVSARASYARQAVQFTQATATATQRVSVGATVSFLHWPWSGIKEVVPSSPPVLPSLPADFLYPFYMPSNSAAAGSAAGLALWTLVVAAAAAVTCLG
jgi:hypothetical protein